MGTVSSNYITARSQISFTNYFIKVLLRKANILDSYFAYFLNMFTNTAVIDSCPSLALLPTFILPSLQTYYLKKSHSARQRYMEFVGSLYFHNKKSENKCIKNYSFLLKHSLEFLYFHLPWNFPQK